MNAKRAVLLALIGVVVAGLGVLALPFDRTYAALFPGHGYIESGHKFGLSVGMEARQANALMMSSGLTPLSDRVAHVANDCGGRNKREGERLKIFVDRSWRNGGVCFF